MTLTKEPENSGSFLYDITGIFRSYNMILITRKIQQFESWFNKNFGWFFMNGRKQSEKLKA